MKRFVAVIGIVFATSANAGEFSFTVNGVSHHSQATYFDHYETTVTRECTYWYCRDVTTVTEVRKEFNENNQGFGVAYNDGWLRLTVGSYKDSYHSQATYALVGFQTTMYFPDLMRTHLTAGFAAGLIHSKQYAYRYKDYVVGNTQSIGVILPYIEFGTNDVRVNLTYAPAMGNEGVSVVAAQLEIPFWK